MTARRGQATVELLVLVGFMFLVYTLALSIGGAHLLSVNAESERSLVEDTARFLENEIRLAAEAEEGYMRQFALPGRFGREYYDIVLHKEENFTEIVVRLVNTSRPFEKTVIGPPGIFGNLTFSPSESEKVFLIEKGNETHIRFVSVLPPTPPEVTTPTLAPAAPVESDDITADAIPTDVNFGDVLSVNFTWRVDGVEVLSEVVGGLASGQAAASVLDESFFGVGQQVGVAVFASDGTFTSATESFAVTVQSP